ncbi:hypothetical protein AXA44_30935 [Rhodococcus sp. SC4]|nr:hypothetical protein AXA44_30935 [Rhodococcus sp. SC4]
MIANATSVPNGKMKAPSPGDTSVSLHGIRHVFTTGGTTVEAISEADVQVRAGEFLSIVGPSGCGKTTLLNMMAGMVQPSTGYVDVLGAPAREGNHAVGYMFARDGLMPWRTAVQNIEFGLQLRGISRTERRTTAMDLLKLVGLAGFEHAYPRRLSQGMRQRVALARTLAIAPSLILLDEPFAALDAQTRSVMHVEFTDIWERTGTTAVLVTHDVAEAVALSDRVIVMTPRPGRIAAEIEIDLPRPRNFEQLRFSKRFHELTEEVWRHFELDLSRHGNKSTSGT